MGHCDAGKRKFHGKGDVFARKSSLTEHYAERRGYGEVAKISCSTCVAPQSAFTANVKLVIHSYLEM
jgi:hypothetical protein